MISMLVVVIFFAVGVLFIWTYIPRRDPRLPDEWIKRIQKAPRKRLNRRKNK